jgi:hypothetical protein
MARPGIVSIVRTALSRAPAPARQALSWAAAASAATLALQAWDVWGRWGPAATAELLSVVATVIGILLLSLVSVIGSGSATLSPAENDDLHPVLLALPLVAFAAGMLIAAAIAFTVARGVLGLHLMRVIPMAGVLLALALALAWGSVRGTTHVLFEHAERRGAQAAEARAALADARIAALQARMQPHFLFNALNTVAELVRSDPAAAEATIEDLSAILRASLADADTPLRPLQQEIQIAKAYAAVEQRRLGGRLALAWRCADDAGQVMVPAWSLQPLVENAIKYAVAARIEGGSVTIEAHRSGERLVVTVRDEGDGFAPAWKDGTGLGSLRERLTALFGDRASLLVENNPGGQVTMTVPVRQEA